MTITTQERGTNMKDQEVPPLEVSLGEAAAGTTVPDVVPRAVVRTERDLRIIDEVVNNNRTFSDVGRQYGITRERVRQIVYAHEPWFEQERKRREGDRRASSRASTVAKLAAAKEVSRTTVEKRRASLVRTYGDEEMLQMLRDWTAVHGQEPTVNLWDGSPTVVTYIKRFGSWATAKKLAGVGGDRRVNRERRWSHEAVVETVLRFLLSDATPSTRRFGSAAYSQWRLEQEPDAPALSTIILHIAPWSVVKSEAIELGILRGLLPGHAEQ